MIEEGAAALWTDGRYFMQAESQLDNDTWTLMKSGLPSTPRMNEWLVETLPPNSNVGIDPFLISAKAFHELDEYLESYGHKLIALQQNLVDVVWKDRPEFKLKELEPIEHTFSGRFFSSLFLFYLYCKNFSLRTCICYRNQFFYIFIRKSLNKLFYFLFKKNKSL